MNQILTFQTFSFLLLAWRARERVYCGDGKLFVKCDAHWPEQFATEVESPGTTADMPIEDAAVFLSAQIFGQAGCIQNKPARPDKAAGITITETGRNVGLIPEVASPVVDLSGFGAPTPEA